MNAKYLYIHDKHALLLLLQDVEAALKLFWIARPAATLPRTRCMHRLEVLQGSITN